MRLQWSAVRSSPEADAALVTVEVRSVLSRMKSLTACRAMARRSSAGRARERGGTLVSTGILSAFSDTCQKSGRRAGSMGKHGMTIEEAATFLGVTGRTVNNYLSRGLLSYRRVAGDRRRYLDAAELGELKSAEGTGLRAPITRAEFLEMRSRLRKLESHMETVLRVLDARAEPLGLDPARAAELHDACAARLAGGGWGEGGLRSR